LSTLAAELVPGVGRRAAGWRTYLCLTLMVLIGSSTAPAAKVALRGLPVGLLPVLRFGIAGLCLLPLACKGGALAGLFRADWKRLLIAAAFCVPINQALFLNGTKLAPVSHTALIYAALPLVVLGLASALGQERLTRRRLLGVLASVIGLAVIAEGASRPGGVSAPGVLLGDLLLVGAVASWGVYVTVSKPLITRHGAIPALAATFLTGSLLTVPIALATSPGWPPLAGISMRAWQGMIYLTLVVTVVGLAFQNQALRRLDASHVTTVGNVAPVLTVLWGVWFFDDPVTPSLAVGGALTVGGALWASLSAVR
jgi:drug/metabolite transporter (DMT)-like permease